jgi:phosphatidylserine/phosphatidylglycerophosphate/cardiolipin synthase-like enzyme
MRPWHSLIALADRAERTLDIQYYIITQDESARNPAAARAPRRRARRQGP